MTEIQQELQLERIQQRQKKSSMWSTRTRRFVDSNVEREREREKESQGVLMF